MTTSRRLAPLPLLASLLRTPRRLTSSRFSPSGKSLPSSPLVLTTSRRLAPLPLLLIALLALGGVLLWSTLADAQVTSRILVSNVLQGGDDSAATSGNDHAQLFHTAANTGTNTDGWVLTSLIVVSEDADGDDFDVDICAVDSNGFPTSTCTELLPPGSFVAGTLEFTAGTGMLLSANTNYTAVFKQANTGSVDLDSTTNNGEDSTGLTGWSIKDKFDFKSSGTWQHKGGSDEAIQITVKGYETVNHDATGRPVVLASAEGAGILAADTSRIDDANGIPFTGSPDAFVDYVYSYQWVRVDGMTETDIVGAESANYQPVEADVGKLIKVKVSFTDRHNYSENVTSLPFGPVAEPGPLRTPTTLVSNTGQSPSATANITQQYFMGFQLGVHGQGYEISSVSIDLAAAPSSLTVSLWTGGTPGTSDAGTPKAKLFDFENPDSFTVGLNEFTAPAGAFAFQNLNHWIVLSGFGSSLSINETTSHDEDAGGDTSVLRLAVKGSRRTSGILVSTYGQTPSGDQEIISLADKIGFGIDLGAADRYVFRGVSFAMDDTTSIGGPFTNPFYLRSGSLTGAKQFDLVITRDVTGLPVWTAPQGATVVGSKTYVFDWDDVNVKKANGVERTGATLSRLLATRSPNVDALSAPGVTLSSAHHGDVALPNPGNALMAVFGDPLYAMVQNLGQTDHAVHLTVGGVHKVASQGFTTGPNAAGYRLQGIGVNIKGSGGNVPDGSTSVSVAVYSADADGKPDTKQFDLLSPTDYAPASLSFFEAPAGTTLAANTSYVVVWSHLNGTHHRLQKTASNAEDSGGLTGFSVADSYYEGTNLSSLSASTDALEIAVYTDRDLTPPKRVTAFDLHSDNSAPRGVWGNDETIWVANDGSGAGNKLFAYNRSDGSRDSSSDFDTLNGAANTHVRGICSDGTTMFVADSDDDKIYAYKMSDTTRDSGKDVTLDSANNSPQGLSCDRTHLWVAEDNDDLTSKIFVYLRSDESHVSTLDIGASTLSPSSSMGPLNNNDQRGMWSNGTTLFVVDHGDTQVYGYKLSDRSQDVDKNLSLDAANADPWGLWFDGRVLWVADTADDKLYVYDLPGAQPGNTAADGTPVLRNATTEEIWAATLTVGTQTVLNQIFHGWSVGGLYSGANLTDTGFTFGGDTYEISAIFNVLGILSLTFQSTAAGDIATQTTRNKLTLHVGSDSFNLGAGELQCTVGRGCDDEDKRTVNWTNTGLSWSASDTVSLSITGDAPPADGDELRADVSDITDDTDGLENVFYHYQWIRVDGTDVTELDGETGAMYTATADDVTKDIQVRVIFDDAFRYREYPRYSPQVTVREVPPVVTGVRLTSNPGSDGIPDYAIGESVTATVTFDKAVDVTSGPQITLLFGTAEKLADCAADTTTTTTMECSYEVKANDTAPDGVGIKANTLALNSGTIYSTGSTTNSATLTHSALALQSGHLVDGIRPTLVTTGNDSPRTSGDGSEIILTFSENINIDSSKFKLFESTTALSTTAFTSLHNKLTIELTTAVLSSAGPLTVELEADAVEDLVGNGILAVGSTTVLNQVSAAPSAPTGLTAEPAPDQTPQLAVDLSWTAPNSDGGSAITSHQYRYKVGTGSLGSWTTIANSAANGMNATSFTVTGLPATSTPPIVFMFEVRAINDNGNGAESDPSATATIDVPDNISLSMATVGNRQVTLTWSTPNNNGSAILRYVYFVYDNVSDTFVVPQNTTIPNSDADTTSFTITGLTNGVLYDVVIKAVNTVGSPDNDPGRYTPMAGPPGKPSVTVQSRVAALYVSWTVDDDGGSNITEYEVQWKSGAQGFDSSRQQAGLTGTNTRIENLINGAEYDVRVRAMNSAGWGEWSDSDSGTPVEGPGVSLSTATLSIDEGGSGAYSVGITTEPTAPVSILISAGGDVTTQPTTLVFTASNWDTRQRVTVNAGQDGDADGDTVTIHHHTVTSASAPEYASLTGLPTIQVTVLDDDTPPPPVRGFSAVDESQDAVALSWWSERGAAEYELEYRKQGDTGNWTRVTRDDFDHLPSTTGNRSLTAIATGLDCNTTYDFRIRLRGSGDILLDAFGPHTEVSRKTGQCAQPDRPTNLMYTLAPDCATLTWTAPTGGDYTGVRIRRLTLGDDNYTVIHESLNSRPTSYRDCTHTGDGYGDGGNPWYAYRVTYIKSGSRGIVESKQARSGLDQYGPAFQDHRHADPRNVRLTLDTDSQRRMTWEAPPSWSLTIWAGLQGATVPVPDPWITGYVVERREFRTRADGYLYFPEVEDELIWSATMTVGSSTSGTPATGYFGVGSGAFGALTPSAFTHSVSSGSWEVTSLNISTATGLRLSIQETPPTDALPTSAFADWVLVVDGRSFPFELDDGVVVGNLQVSWANHGLSWTNGQQVSVQLVERELFEWERLRRGRDGDTSTSFTDNEQANGRKFVYRVMTTNTRGTSTNRAIFDWLFDSPYRDAVVDLAATDTTTDDEGAGDGRTNNAATGAPAITGTPQVGETLTASTSGIADTDGLTNMSYRYQWIAGGTDIGGATGSSYTLTAGEQGQTIQVRVTFTDDANNEETLTSEATAEVTAAPVPLTASRPDSRFQSARHKGADDRPQVIVAFSLPVASFEKTTPSVSLTGAAVSSVRRHQEDGLDNAWIFFLDPDGDDDIVLSLVTGRPCDSGGICTEDGTTLSGGVQVTLPGPEEEEQEEAGDDQQTPQSPPPKPTGLTATVNADGHIVLSWTAPNDDSITGYQVLRRRPGEGESTLLVYVADTRSTATTFTDTGVTAGVKHVYRVKAINAAGLSGWFNYVNPMP